MTDARLAFVIYRTIALQILGKIPPKHRYYFVLTDLEMQATKR
jgi:hypothetical protein